MVHGPQSYTVHFTFQTREVVLGWEMVVLYYGGRWLCYIGVRGCWVVLGWEVVVLYYGGRWLSYIGVGGGCVILG